MAPNIASCLFTGVINGPPAVKIPVSALTTTYSTTLSGTNPNPTRTPAPANPIKTSTAPATVKPSVKTPTKPADAVTESLPASTSGSRPGTSGADSDAVPNSDSSSDAPVDNPAIPTETLPVIDQGDDTPDEVLGQTGSDSNTVPDSQSNSDAPVNNPATTTSNPPVVDQGVDISDEEPGALEDVETRHTSTIKLEEPTPEVIIISGIKSAATITPIPPVPVVIAGDTIYLPPSTTKLPVAGTTLSVNGPAATVSGQHLSLADGVLVVGTQTHPFLAPAATAINAVGGQTFSQVAQNGAIVVAGNTISLGGPAIEIGGVPISLNPSAIIYGSSTVVIPPFTPTNVITAAGAYNQFLSIACMPFLSFQIVS